MGQRRFERDADRGHLEKWNAELLEKNKMLETKLRKAKVPMTEHPLGSRTLQECEAVIENGLSAHVEAWFAIQEIHDRDLYKPKWDSFKDYCMGRWGYRAEGYRYLQAAQVSQVLRHAEMSLPPTSAHARALAPLLNDPDKMKEAWAESLELNDGHPTFLDVKDVVDGFLPKDERSAEPSPAEAGSQLRDDGARNDTSSGTAGLKVQRAEGGALATSVVSPEGSGLRDSASEATVEPDFHPLSDKLSPTPQDAESPIVASDILRADMIPPGPAPVDFSFPTDGLWTLETIRQHRGKINGWVRECSRHVSEPDVKVHLQSLYNFIKDALGYDV